MRRLVFLISILTVVLLSSCGVGGNADLDDSADTIHEDTADEITDGVKSQLPAPRETEVTPEAKQSKSNTAKSATPKKGKPAPQKVQAEVQDILETPQNTEAEKHEQVEEQKDAEKIPARDMVSVAIMDTGTGKMIFPATAVSIARDETVFDVLKRVTRENKIHMEFTGGGTNVYVEGIDNLYEFDRGPESGWVYLVNGRVASVSASATKLNPGDEVVWEYREKAINELSE